jgi:hypothetical protein
MEYLFMLENGFLGLVGLWEEMKEFGEKMRKNLFQTDFWKMRGQISINLTALIVAQEYGKL